MKHKFLLILIAGTIAISGINSCKKDELSTSPGGGAADTINLIANRWLSESDGFYTDNLYYVIPQSNNQSRFIRIYLVENGQKRQINQSISFMGGELWATHTSTDVKILYRNSRKTNLPFDKLNITLVME